MVSECMAIAITDKEQSIDCKKGALRENDSVVDEARSGR